MLDEAASVQNSDTYIAHCQTKAYIITAEMAQSILSNKEFGPNLIEFIQEGKNEEAKLLLQHANEQPQYLVDSTGSNLLHYAVKFNNIEIVRYLVRVGCKNNTFNSEGHTPLMLAVMNNHMDLVSILFKRISDAHYKKLLVVMFGCEKVSPDIVKYVFQKLKKTNDKALAKLLLETKCPLYYAVFLNRIRIIKIMIDNGCSVNIKNPFDGNSPLHIAVAREELDLVRLLVKHGANVNAVNHKGEIPLNNRQAYTFPFQLNMLKILLEKGSLVTSCDNSGRMQIFKIFPFLSHEPVKMILHSNINLNDQDQHGDTVVHYCAQYNQLSEVFSLLIKRDFNPNIQNLLGYTPLHFLCDGSKYLHEFQTLHVLLAKGADLNIKSREIGITPFHKLINGFKSPWYPNSDAVNADFIRHLLAEYGADIQCVTNADKTILDEIDVHAITDKTCATVLSYFALLEAQGTMIIEPIRRQIDSNDWMKSRIKSYSSNLEQLKTIEIHELVTIFRLLTCSKIKFRSYLRNKQLATKLRRVLACNAEGVDKMYIELLKTRMTGASNITEWQQKAEVVFCKLVGSSVRFPDLIFNEIMNYLNLMDLKNLASVKCYTSKRERSDSDEDTYKRKCR